MDPPAVETDEQRKTRECLYSAHSALVGRLLCYTGIAALLKAGGAIVVTCEFDATNRVVATILPYETRIEAEAKSLALRTNPTQSRTVSVIAAKEAQGSPSAGAVSLAPAVA